MENRDEGIDFFGAILPPEVTHAILSYLSPLDVVSASQVSKTFAGLLDSRGIWKRIVEEQFGPLDEQIFKGNTINWRKTYSRCSELSKWKKYFLLAEACKLHLPPHGEYPGSKYSMDDNALIVYQDKHKKKPCARLNLFTTSATGYSTKLLGFTGKRALIGTRPKHFLWDLTVDCKHTDEHKWKSAPNKEICKKKCSFIREFEIASVVSNYFWSDELKSIFCFTNEGIHSINLDTEEASFCTVKFLKYQEKMALTGSWINVYRNTTKLILYVRAVTINGIQTTFCLVQFCGVLLFVNVTTQVVHLALSVDCRICWLPNSRKVAVLSELRYQMRVVDIAEEQPKILAKYNFDKRWDGVVSSPEGHVLFLWRWTRQVEEDDKLLMRAYLWEIGYTIGEVADVAVKEYNLARERASKESWFMLTSGTVIYFNHVMRF